MLSQRVSWFVKRDPGSAKLVMEEDEHIMSDDDDEFYNNAMHNNGNGNTGVEGVDGMMRRRMTGRRLGDGRGGGMGVGKRRKGRLWGLI